jgi:guanylate kinase
MDPLTARIKEQLKTYQPRPEAIEILKNTYVLLLVGITGAGRNRIIKELVKDKKFHFIVSHTTRPPRVNEGVLEQNGIEYYFIDNKTLLSMVQQGEFVECKFIHNQQFSGTSLTEISKAAQNNQIAATDLEVQGVDEYMYLKPDTVAVFVLPPNFSEWQRRLEKRGESDKAEVKRRLESALMEIKMALSKDYYHFVVNDDLKKSVRDIKALAEGKNLLIGSEAEGRKLAEQLLKDIQSHLGGST